LAIAYWSRATFLIEMPAQLAAIIICREHHTDGSGQNIRAICSRRLGRLVWIEPGRLQLPEASCHLRGNARRGRPRRPWPEPATCRNNIGVVRALEAYPQHEICPGNKAGLMKEVLGLLGTILICWEHHAISNAIIPKLSLEKVLRQLEPRGRCGSIAAHASSDSQNRRVIKTSRLDETNQKVESSNKA